jgi:hypothetical protein
MVPRRFQIALTLCLVAVASKANAQTPSSGLPIAANGLPASLAPVPDSLLGVPERGQFCPTRLHNGQDTTLFLLRRSDVQTRSDTLESAVRIVREGHGFYELFPSSGYGLTSKEWLEIDCGSLKALRKAKADV